MRGVNRVVIIGGGPGGYESALVAAQLGAEVTVVESAGLGGSAVLTDCVPSKTLIATAELMADMEEAAELGIRFPGTDSADGVPAVDLGRVNSRVKNLARAQSQDIERRLTRDGVRFIRGRGRLDRPARLRAAASTPRADGDVRRRLGFDRRGAGTGRAVPPDSARVADDVSPAPGGCAGCARSS